MNKTTFILFVLLSFVLMESCEKWDSYKSLSSEGDALPGVVSSLMANPGKGRVMLSWNPGTDSRVVKYTVYWNNRADSIVVPVSGLIPGDTVKCFIENLAEYSYSFTVLSYDAKGTASVPVQLSNVRTYGANYRSGLLNRLVSLVDYTNEIVSISWRTPDTINVNTSLKYRNTAGEEVLVNVHPDSTNTALTNWAPGTTIYYRSSFKPLQNAIDTFTVPFYDSLKVGNLLADKSIWKQVRLPFDISADGYGTSLRNIWNGKPGGYENGTGIYHALGSDPMPQHFTIDLGKVYTELTQFEQWGRQDCACHNPNKFEVWGIMDTTGAVTTLRSDNDGWKNESLSKGWTLLAEVNRTDDGVAGIKVNLPGNLPPIRFIRIRVLKTLDNSPESHMSEISFRYNL